MSTETDEYPPANLYERLAVTLAQHSISHETAKLLSLQLANGISRQQETGADIRGQIHLGILFDAETDTASLLTQLNDIDPDSTYVNGTGSSTSGLIADARNGTLDTGVVLCGDYEAVLIDNAASLDERTMDSLDQILSSGSYTVSKSGIHETRHTDSSILLVDTLQYGSRDEIMSVDEELDHLLPPSTKNRLDVASIDSGQSNDSDKIPLGREKIQSGLERAREIEPELKPGTADYLETKVDERLDFEQATISIETVRRLAEACARLDYNETVTSHHVNLVVQLLYDVFDEMYGESEEAETGRFDAEVIETGSSKTQRDRIKSIEDLIIKVEREHEGGAPIEEVLDRAEELGMSAAKAEKEIENLRRKGEAYEPSQGYVSADW